MFFSILPGAWHLTRNTRIKLFYSEKECLFRLPVLSLIPGARLSEEISDSSEPLIDCNRYGVGKIQTPVEFSRHGNCIKAGFVFFMQLRRKSPAFTSKNQESTFFHGTIPETRIMFRRKEIHRRITGIGCKRLPVFMDFAIHMRPVVHAGPPEILVLKGK